MFVAGRDSVVEMCLQLIRAEQLWRAALLGEWLVLLSPRREDPLDPTYAGCQIPSVVLVRGPLARSPSPAPEEGEALHNANKGR